jgi:hypothetical protein
MESTILVIVLAIVAITIAYVIPLAQSHFVHNGWYGSTEKTESFEGGRYNPLAATQTVGSLNRMIPDNDLTGSGVNRTLRSALDTPVLTPGGGTITTTTPINAQTSAAVPGRNKIAAAAAVCEKQSGVGTCAMLDDPAFSTNCGVCIKGGSRSTDTTTGAWVGGLYMSPADQSNVAIMKIAPQPTAGACPTGSFCPGADRSAVLACPRGAFCPGTGNANFTLCPRGTYQPALGAAASVAHVRVSLNGGATWAAGALAFL